MRTGVANLSLIGGTAPEWLLERMKRVRGKIITVIFEFIQTLLKKLQSDPIFQSPRR